MSRSVLITGGSSGIGRATVANFAAAGDRVIAVGRDEEALKRLAADFHSGATSPIETIACDVTDEDAVERAFEAAGPLDVLVNNAGFAESAPIERTSLSDWQRHLDVNATGAFLCTRAAIRGMRERGSGSIITVASTAARVGTPYTAAYTASKHAVVGLMRATAAELAGTGIRANAVCPTFVNTPMTDRSLERIATKTGRSRDESAESLASASPLGRLLEVHEVADVILWLASDAARAINAQTLIIDGGGIQA